MDILDILLDILLKPCQPLMGLFLNRGVTFALRQSLEIVPDSNDLWKMSCKIGVHASQHSFSNLPLIRLGPAALWMLRPLMSLVIPATPIWKEGIWGCGLGPLLGGSPSGSWVKTDWNWVIFVVFQPIISFWHVFRVLHYIKLHFYVTILKFN